MATHVVTLSNQEYEALMNYDVGDHVLLLRPSREEYRRGDVLWVKDQERPERWCWRRVRHIDRQEHGNFLSLDIMFGETKGLEIPQDYAGKLPSKAVEL